MAKAMSYEPNLIVSCYTDLRYDPITRLFVPVDTYQDAPQLSLEDSIKPVSHLFDRIERYVSVAKENSKNPANGLSQDESASIYLYTMQFDSGSSLYEVLNKALCDENRLLLRSWTAFLNLFLTALRKLPSRAQTLWRGVREENPSSKYSIGSEFAWWGVSSCTTTIKTLENDIYLGRTGLRTLFSIECKNGKSVEAHSCFKEYEKEVILMPGSYFEVVGQLDAGADLCIIHLKEIDPPVSPVKLPVDLTPMTMLVTKSSDNQRVENDTSNVNTSFQEALTIATSQEAPNIETIIATVMPYLSQLSILVHSQDQQSTDVLIENMIKEEQRMEKVLLSMKPGEEHMKLEIKRMKLREKRMEHEIQRMTRLEESAGEVIAVGISLADNESSLQSEIEDRKQRGEILNYEISRIEHHKNRLENEIRSMKHEIERIKNRLMVIETAFGQVESHGEMHQIKNNHTNREKKPEELHNELHKCEMKLAECLDEIKKRKTEVEKSRAKRIECESELQNLRTKAKQEKERREREKQVRMEAIQRRENHEKELKRLRARRIKRETELSEYTTFRVESLSNIENSQESIIVSRTCFEKTCIALSNAKYRLHEMVLSCEIIRAPSPSATQYYMDSGVVEYYAASGIIEQPKYDILLSFPYQDDSIITRIKNALPSRYVTQCKSNFSSSNIKTCLDTTSTVVIAITNKFYELGKTCQADLIHIFKRQFPLVLVITEEDFKPTGGNPLNLVWHAPNTQKVYMHLSDFEENLRNANKNAQWNLSPNRSTLRLTQPTTDEGSNRFVGGVHEWTIAYNDPAKVSENYRQFITDPLRITTDIKLRDFLDYYIRIYFANSDVENLIEKGVKENNMTHFIRAYTCTKTNVSFSETLNRHLSAYVLYYFESTLDDTVDYRLVKCLIDFVALCIFRQELQAYPYSGTAYRGMMISEADLCKYIVGSRIMNTSFLSASRDRKVATILAHTNEQEYGVICAYEIHNQNNRRTAVAIDTMSMIPDEAEVLILPFSAFAVKSVTRSPDGSKPIEMTLIEMTLIEGTLEPVR